MSYNLINNIKINAFNNLPLLTNIDLSYNKINNIKIDSFNNLSLLNTINLSNNEIININSGTFNDFQLLEYIDLSGNKIKKINSETFFNLPSLVSIDLSNNEITKINPNAFINIDLLQNIDLSSNQISTISLQIFNNLKNIDTIYLAFNMLIKIEEIPTTIEETTKDLLNCIDYHFNYLPDNYPNCGLQYSKYILFLLNLNLNYKNIYDVITDYELIQKFKKSTFEILKKENTYILSEINGYFQNSEIDNDYHIRRIKDMIQKIQYLSIIVNLKRNKLDNKQLLDTFSQTNEDLKQNIEDIYNLNISIGYKQNKNEYVESKNNETNIQKTILEGEDTQNAIKDFLGGANYKNKYLKYKTKYLKLKNK